MPAAIRIIAIIIESLFLIWFILPAAFRIVKAGNILGVIICAVALFRTAFSSYYHALSEWMQRNEITDALWIIIRIGWFLFIAYAVIISVCMVIAMNAKPAANAAAIILGAQVKPWGASRLLRQRITAAERYLCERPEAIAVVSGGQGKNEPMTEAKCMFDCLTADGIPPERILTEDRSVNTEQNLRYSLQIIKERAMPESIVIISDSYHQLRARIIAHKIDCSIRVGACNTVNTKFGVLVYPSYFVREWIAIPVEILKKNGKPARHHTL